MKKVFALVLVMSLMAIGSFDFFSDGSSQSGADQSSAQSATTRNLVVAKTADRQVSAQSMLKPGAKLIYDKDGNCITPGSQMNDPLEPKGDVADDAGVTDAPAKNSHRVGLDAALDAANKIPEAPAITPSATKNTRFTKQGTDLMLGWWARGTAPALADVNYREYFFAMDGTFVVQGFGFAERFKDGGEYRLEADGKTLDLAYTRVTDKGTGEWRPCAVNYVTCRVDQSDGTFIDAPGIMKHGVRWDYRKGDFIGDYTGTYTELLNYSKK